MEARDLDALRWIAIRERLERFGVITEASESSSTPEDPIEVRSDEDFRGLAAGRRMAESKRLPRCQRLLAAEIVSSELQ